MIRVTSNNGIVDIHEVSGNGVQVMSDLCCIVAAVCQGWCEDEEDSEGMKRSMILSIARTLLMAEEELNGKKVD